MMNEDECGLKNEEKKSPKDLRYNNKQFNTHSHREIDEGSAEIHCILWLATHIHTYINGTQPHKYKQIGNQIEEDERTV